MMEKTLVMIKPDGVQRALVGDIISRFEKCGLKIVAMKMLYATKEQAGKHYAEDEEWLISVGEKTLKGYEKRGEKLERTPLEQGQWVRQMLMEYISMSPVVALVFEGHNAVANVRKICGSTSPSDAQPGTIRGDYAIETFILADTLKRPVQNLIHASGTPEEAKREIKVWFDEDEMHVWQRVDEGFLYRKWGN